MPELTVLSIEYGTKFLTLCYDCDKEYAAFTVEYEHLTMGYGTCCVCPGCVQQYQQLKGGALEYTPTAN